jgi:predicted nuclease of predicted toxin-antitoxin system
VTDPGVVRVLLDANLSRRIARHLAAAFGFDAVSLWDLGLETLRDRQVVALAHRTGRLLITLDEDFVHLFNEREASGPGIVYLDLPNTHRPLRDVLALIEAFFRSPAGRGDLRDALVRITDVDVTIIRRS